jgi:hypothetical protein
VLHVRELVLERAGVRHPADDLSCIGEQHPRSRAIGKRELHSGQLDHRLDGKPRNGAREHRAQSLCPHDFAPCDCHVAVLERCPRDGCEGDRTQQVLLEVARLHSFEGAFSEPPSRFPVASPHGQQGPLGERHRRGRMGSGAFGRLHCVGEDDVGSIHLTGQEVAYPVQGKPHRSPRAAFGFEANGNLCVLPHPLDTVPAGQGLEQAQRRLR